MRLNQTGFSALFLLILLLVPVCICEALVWQARSTGITESAVYCVVADPMDGNILYAGVEGRIFKSLDGGVLWRAIFDLPGVGIGSRTDSIMDADRQVLDLEDLDLLKSLGFVDEEVFDLDEIDEEELVEELQFAGYDVVGYEREEDEKEVEEVSVKRRDAVIRDILVVPGVRHRVLAATARGIYQSLDQGMTWRSLSHGFGGVTEVSDLVVTPGSPPIFYLATESGVDRSPGGEGPWESVPGLPVNERFVDLEPARDGSGLYLLSAEALYWFDSERERVDVLFRGAGSRAGLSCVLEAGDGLYVGSDQGLFRKLAGEGLFTRLAAPGMASDNITRLAWSATDRSLYIGTDKGVFEWLAEAGRFREQNRGFQRRLIHHLRWTGGSQPRLWAATVSGLYVADFSVEPDIPVVGKLGDEPLFGSYAGREPDLFSVQRAAQRSAALNRDRYASWFPESRRQWMLPEVFFVAAYLDRSDESASRSSTISLTEGAVTIGPDDLTVKEGYQDSWVVSVSLVWRPGRSLFSQDRVSIHDRVMKNAEFRRKLDDKVARLCKVRRELMAEAVMNGRAESLLDRIRRDLQIQETTAVLDGLTSGYFSRMIRDSVLEPVRVNEGND